MGEEILAKQEKDMTRFNKDFEGRFNVIEKTFGKDKEKLIEEIANLKKKNTQKYFENLNDAIRKMEKLVPKENIKNDIKKNNIKNVNKDDDDETLTLISKPLKKADETLTLTLISKPLKKA